MDKYSKRSTARLWIALAVLMATCFTTKIYAQDAVTKAVESAAVIVEEPVLDSGNTAWIITATILVLLMSIPGIALFYGGLVRQKNVLSIIMQTLFIVGVVSILWVAFGYSWAFGTDFME